MSAQPKGRRMRVIVATLLASTVFALLLAEAVVRVAGLGPAPHPVSHGKVVRPSQDPVLRFEHRPHASRARVFQESRHSEPRIALYTIDGHGFRRPSVELQKPEGSFRIACVGDSFTFGTGVNDLEAWPAVLQELLRARGGSPGDGAAIEVMNCGVGGYNTVQEARFLEQRVLRFQPDLVLGCLYLNDVMVGTQPPKAEVSERVRFLRRWTRPARDDWVRSLRRASVLVDLVCDRIYRGMEARLYTQRHADVFTGDGEGWRLAREALRKMRADSEASGADFLLVLYPQLARAGGVLASHEAYAVVKAFAQEEGMRCLDLEGAFLGQPVERFWVHPTDLHPNPAGQRVAAAAIADFLVGEGLVPGIQGE